MAAAMEGDEAGTGTYSKYAGPRIAVGLRISLSFFVYLLFHRSLVTAVEIT